MQNTKVAQFTPPRASGYATTAVPNRNRWQKPLGQDTYVKHTYMAQCARQTCMHARVHRTMCTEDSSIPTEPLALRRVSLDPGGCRESQFRVQCNNLQDDRL